MERRLIQPKTIEQTLEERERYAGDGMPIAGGQSLLVLLRNKLIAPRVLIDLEGLGELRGVRETGDRISIGAMATIFNLMSLPVIGAAIPVLAEAASKVGSTAIRNLGTVGGNVCHNELGADLPPALLTLNAEAELRSRKRSRRVPLGQFFRDYFETVVEPDEIVCRIEAPRLPQGATGVYLKHAISPEDMAIVGVAVVVVPDGSSERAVSEVRIGLGGVAPVPFRASKAEAALKGAVLDELDEKAIREAGAIAAEEADPATDPHGTAEYRKKMIQVFVRRAILAALEKQGRGSNGKA